MNWLQQLAWPVVSHTCMPTPKQSTHTRAHICTYAIHVSSVAHAIHVSSVCCTCHPCEFYCICKCHPCEFRCITGTPDWVGNAGSLPRLPNSPSPVLISDTLKQKMLQQPTVSPAVSFCQPTISPAVRFCSVTVSPAIRFCSVQSGAVQTSLVKGPSFRELRLVRLWAGPTML